MRIRNLLSLAKKIARVGYYDTLLNKLKYESILKRFHHIFHPEKIYWYFFYRIPQQHHLSGTILHRIFGEQLFDPRIWKPTRKSISGGLAVGLLIALTPTIGVQMILSIMVSYFLRVNIPAAVATCWITNPLTAPIIYPLQYKLGLWIGGAPEADELTGYTGMLRHFIRYARPLWIGSLLSASFCAIFMYIAVFFAWGVIVKLKKHQ